ncbi:MAG: HNH endonuclease [Bacteroidetes bacterium]|nr:MAG: HNH endonuclease [Bacteroidota bacterium]MBL1145155.1 HNH endonuclease [Bacteroidota bacterium]NOG57951.1 HNH endonuclease [Bacteroidota bacterium]
MNNKLAYYIKKFKSLKRAHNNGGAPHKPILLLSLIHLFRTGFYTNNHIEVTPEFVATFRNYWNKLVLTNHTLNFALPFYHMKSEPFWSLEAKLGFENAINYKGSMRSIGNLIKAVKHAKIDQDLTHLLINPESSEILKLTLLEKYFPEHKNTSFSYQTDIFNVGLINEDSESYKKGIIEIKNSIDEESFQEEVYVRSGIFKREIPKIYNNTCAISGLRIDATSTISMVDACHITPFSESYDCSIQNGISLSPNLHRAFDRGLISISDDYKVLVKDNFIENLKSSYNLNQFANKSILLPNSPNQYPSLENLYLHRKRFDFRA